MPIEHTVGGRHENLMANDRPKPVVIDPKGGPWWEFPDALWKKVTALQRIRLRRTVSEQVLPLLRQIEALVPRPKESRLPHLKGRSLDDIENDIPLTVFSLQLLDIALAKKLLTFAGSKGKGPVGSCGMSLKQARSFFLRGAAERIMENAGHDPKKLDKLLGMQEFEAPSMLHKLEMMVRFAPATLSALQNGLGNNIGKLFDCDEQFFVVLRDSKPQNFVHPLAKVLGKDFKKILDWDGAFFAAISEGLDHSAKIVALGRNILDIEDAEIIRALGRWPIKETMVNDKKTGKRKTYVTRIGTVREALGSEFRILLNSGPDIIDQAEDWTADEIERIKFHVAYINGEVITTLSELPFAYTVNIMDGLWALLGREFMETQLTTPECIAALKSMAAKIIEMGIETTTAEKIKSMIEKNFFDDQLAQFQ